MIAVEKGYETSIFADSVSWNISLLREVSYSSNEYYKYGDVNITSLGDMKWAVYVKGDKIQFNTKSTIEMLTSNGFDINAVTNSYSVLSGSDGVVSQDFIYDNNTDKGCKTSMTASYFIDKNIVFIPNTSGSLVMLSGAASIEIKTCEIADKTDSTIEVLDDYMVKVIYEGVESQWWDIY